MPFAPIIGLAFILYYGSKVLYQLPKHRTLYQQTLFNGSREKYGRIPGQDYMQWNGKQISPFHKKCIIGGAYWNGAQNEDFIYSDSTIETPFCTEKDLRWLKLEYLRCKENVEIEILRRSLYALIPFVGSYALINLFMGRSVQMSDSFWYWDQALEFHIENCKKKLGK